MQKVLKTALSFLLSIALAAPMFAAGALPVRADDAYEFSVTLSQEDSYKVGDTVTLTAGVTKNGEAITNLEEAGLYVYFWKDEWSGPYQTEGYELSNDGNSGRSLTASVTFTAPGEYCVGYNLQDSEWNTIAGNYYAQFSVEEEAVEGTSVTVTPDKTEDIHVGDTVTLAADLTLDGRKVADLSAEECYMYFWGDDWSDGYCHNFTIEKDDQGKTLGAKITFNEAGTYRVGYDVENANWEKIVNDTYIEFEVTEAAGPAYPTDPVVGEIEVERVDGLTSDFVMGMDISYAPSEFAAGVVYKDFDGNDITNINDFVAFLADCGITAVRVRIWNDPHTADGLSYGGGNADLANAVTIAFACAAAGVDLLPDFHYSDFWADPGRQNVPKAWAGLSGDTLAAALHDFTLESLNTLSATGVNIPFVQVGNETTGGVGGQYGVANMIPLFKAGVDAVHEFSADTKAVIHVTNPEKGNVTGWAKNLAENDVPYDVLATSYYPYWHGSLDHLKSELKAVRDTYGKDVMVTETSYTYTLEDSDGFENTIKNEGSKGANAYWPSTVQGQATAVREVINTVAEAGGLGVFYWEPDQITVGDTTGLSGDELAAKSAENREKWETYGCGWATKAAAAYDANVGEGGIWAGGSPIDNEAMWGPDGSALASLHVWEYVKTGSVTNELLVTNYEEPTINLNAGESVTWPETIPVTYSRSSIGTKDDPVVWSEEEKAAADTSKPGTYKVSGTVTLSEECTDGTTGLAVTLTIIVKEPNLITDPNVAGFENGDGWTITGSGARCGSNEDVLDGAKTLHWYNANGATIKVTANESITLAPGFYTLEGVGMGSAGDKVTLNVLDADGNVLEASEAGELAGWTTDPGQFVHVKKNFFVTEETTVKPEVELTVLPGGWGSFDTLYLHRHENPVSEEIEGTEEPLHRLVCGDCGETLLERWFADVTEMDKWYFGPVYKAAEAGITTGKGDSFDPNGKLTRAEAVAFFYKKAGSPDVSELPEAEFTDVTADDWYHDAVRWAKANGITSGYGQGTFRPDAVVNRAMVVTFLMNYAKFAGRYEATEESAGYTDVPEGIWYEEAVNWAAHEGLTVGYGENTFQPTVPCTRAMMVTFLVRMPE